MIQNKCRSSSTKKATELFSSFLCAVGVGFEPTRGS